MELEEAIPLMVLGFMALIGFWLAGLTYLMFKHQKEETKEESPEEKASEKEVKEETEEETKEEEKPEEPDKEAT